MLAIGICMKFLFIHIQETYFCRQTKMSVINDENSEELRKSAVMTPSLVLDYENWLATLGLYFFQIWSNNDKITQK